MSAVPRAINPILYSFTTMLVGLSTSAVAEPLMPSSQSNAESGANIIVVGKRGEVRRSASGPHQIRISPQGTLRADADSWLRRESFMAQPQSGQPSPGQFSLPKFRNLDMQYSTVDIEGIPIQDPYSGLPFITDVDLRAFQSLTIHRGLPSYDVPALTPGGSLSLSLGLTKTHNEIGGSYGQPYGQASYLKSGFVNEDDDLKGQLYARGMQGSGHYRFYDDNGTPLNGNDDRYRDRHHNDQKDQLLFPYFEGRSGATSLKLVGIYHDADRAIPAPSTLQNTATERVQVTDQVAAWVVAFTPWRVWLPHTSIEWQHLQAKQSRLTSDGRSPAVAEASDQSFQAQQQRDGLALRHKGEVCSLHLAAAASSATIELTDRFHTAMALERLSATALYGMRLDLPESPVYIELKSERLQHRDRVLPYSEVGAGNLRTTRRSSSQSNGVTVGLDQVPLNPNLQAAEIQRLPSLFEAFGDGVSVLSQQDLAAEHIKHVELSLAESYETSTKLAWFASVYRDEIREKIVLVPSRSNFLQAQNLRSIKQLGADLTVEVVRSSINVLLNYSYQNSKDQTFTQVRSVPLAPHQTIVLEIGHSTHERKVYVLSRYVSKVYRDASNSVELPAHRTEDVGVEQKFGKLTTSFVVQNMFDVMSGQITAGDQRGRTARSDFRGRPLPGRQFLGSIAWQF